MMKKLLISLLISTSLLIGCKSTPSKPDVPVPPHKVASTLIGVGYPWDYYLMDAPSVAKELAKRGVTLTEIDADIFSGDVNLLKKYIDEFRKYKITTLLVVVNGNSEEIVAKPSSWFEGFIQQIKTVIGPDYVILNAVSEPGNRNTGDKGKVQHWIDYALKNWPGKTSLTVEFEWAKPFEGKSTYKEYHLCHDPNESNMSGANNIFVTDCGKTLGLDPNRAAIGTRAAIKKSTNFLVYEAHRDHSGKIDFSTLNAVGQEIQK